MQGQGQGRTIIYVNPYTRDLLRKLKEKYRLRNNSEAILVLLKFFEEEERKIGQLEMAKKVFSILVEEEGKTIEMAKKKTIEMAKKMFSSLGKEERKEREETKEGGKDDKDGSREAQSKFEGGEEGEVKIKI